MSSDESEDIFSNSPIELEDQKSLRSFRPSSSKSGSSREERSEKKRQFTISPITRTSSQSEGKKHTLLSVETPGTSGLSSSHDKNVKKNDGKKKWPIASTPIQSETNIGSSLKSSSSKSVSSREERLRKIRNNKISPIEKCSESNVEHKKKQTNTDPIIPETSDSSDSESPRNITCNNRHHEVVVNVVNPNEDHENGNSSLFDYIHDVQVNVIRPEGEENTSTPENFGYGRERRRSYMNEREFATADAILSLDPPEPGIIDDDIRRQLREEYESQQQQLNDENLVEFCDNPGRGVTHVETDADANSEVLINSFRQLNTSSSDNATSVNLDQNKIEKKRTEAANNKKGVKTRRKSRVRKIYHRRTLKQMEKIFSRQRFYYIGWMSVHRCGLKIRNELLGIYAPDPQSPERLEPYREWKKKQKKTNARQLTSYGEDENTSEISGRVSENENESIHSEGIFSVRQSPINTKSNPMQLSSLSSSYDKRSINHPNVTIRRNTKRRLNNPLTLRNVDLISDSSIEPVSDQDLLSGTSSEIPRKLPRIISDQLLLTSFSESHLHSLVKK